MNFGMISGCIIEFLSFYIVSFRIMYSGCFIMRVPLMLTYLRGTSRRLLKWSTCFIMRMHSTRIYVLGYFVHIGNIVCLLVHLVNIRQTFLLSMLAMPVLFEVEIKVDDDSCV